MSNAGPPTRTTGRERRHTELYLPSPPSYLSNVCDLVTSPCLYNVSGKGREGTVTPGPGRQDYTKSYRCSLDVLTLGVDPTCISRQLEMCVRVVLIFTGSFFAVRGLGMPERLPE